MKLIHKQCRNEVDWPDWGDWEDDAERDEDWVQCHTCERPISYEDVEETWTDELREEVSE